MGDKRIADLGDQLDQAVSQSVRIAIMAASAMDGEADASNSFYLGIRSMLGALNPTAMIVAKRKRISEQEFKEKSREELQAMAMRLLTQESMMFTCVVAALAQNVVNPEEGSIQCEVGPSTFLEALGICEKIFGKPIDDKLDEALVIAAQNCEKGSNLPLEELLAKRAVAHLPPKAVQ